MNAELQWLYSEFGRRAHLCAINRDEGQVKAAAICNYISPTGEWNPATPESSRCVTCQNMSESEKRIVFIMPDTGERITVREGRK